MPLVDPALSIPDAHVWIVLASLLVSLVIFLTDALKYEIVAILVVLVLATTGVLSVDEAFSGFSSPALVLIVSMYVFGHAFHRCGVAEAIGHRFLKYKEGGEASLVLRLVLVSGCLSAFLSNTGVVATLIPVCSGLARRHKIPISKLLMPMSFGSLLGGIITLVATSKNIAVNQGIEELNGTPFTLFEFTHFGLMMLAIGVLYFWGPGRWLLPKTNADQSLTERYQVPKFVTEVLVEPSSTLINRSVADTELFVAFNITVLGIVRQEGEGTILAPSRYNRIRSEDTLILQGEPDDILRMRQSLELAERRWVDTGDTRLYSDDVRLIEAVVPAGSSFVGQTLVAADFRDSTGLNVLAMSKHGELQLQRMLDTSMAIGDTLLIQGHLRDIQRLRDARQLIVLEELEHGDLSRGAKTSIALMAGVLLLACFSSVNLAVLAMWGAVGLVLTRTVRAAEVAKVINWSVVALLGGMLALGHAFHKVGLDDSIVNWMTSLGDEGFSPHKMLIVLLIATVLLTQVLNYVTTAVIMTPVAISLADNLGVDSRPFLMAVIAGSEFAFLSPVAHQSNAMVLGPGGYRYKHFIVVGLPLTIILVIASSILIPWLWPF